MVLDTAASSSTVSDAFLKPGVLVWVPCHEEVWQAGVVVESDKQHAVVKVRCEHGEATQVIEVQTSKAGGSPPCLRRFGELLSIEAAEAVEDLSMLPLLAEPEILHAARMRYNGDNIYTFIGPMLLAVNPYHRIPGLYEDEMLHEFANAPQGCPVPMPHIYGIARDAFLGIQHGNISQTLLVSGESGAGKTENVKLMIRFLALAGGQQPATPEATMGHRVLESIPLFEALGNARTLKNDNSSRFGKFTELHFHQPVGIVGPCIKQAETHTYLLETMRVTNLTDGELGFHIFYQILAAAARAKARTSEKDSRPDGMTFQDAIAVSTTGDVSNPPRGHSHEESAHEMRCSPGKKISGFVRGNKETASSSYGCCSINEVGRNLQLSPVVPDLVLPDIGEWSPQQFRFLARSTYEGELASHTAAQFDRTLESLRSLNFCDDDISQIMGAIVAVLYLGNIEFCSIPNSPEESEIRDCNDFTGPLFLASFHLGVDCDSLASALCSRVIQCTKQSIRKGRTKAQALECCNALARHLYGMVFAYVVSRVNEASSALDDSNHDSTSAITPTVGVLDMFGFEVFDHNCFEQFCINYANEVLQQHFTMVVFNYELALYEQEGIPVDRHEMDENAVIAEQRICDSGALLASVFPLLEDECIVSGGAAKSWLHKVEMTMSKSNTRRAFSMVRHMEGHFLVHHFAGPVVYCGDAFLEKNRDALCVEALECVQGGSNAVLQHQLGKFGHQSVSSGTPLRSKAYSVSSEFRKQLDGLMKKVQATRARFVCCIKPNHLGVAHVFDSLSILEQLRYQGVIEAIRVARAGYTLRLGHQQAVLTYWMLASYNLRCQLEKYMRLGKHREAALALFANLNEKFLRMQPGGARVGKALTFLRTPAVEELGIYISRYREGGAVQIQAAWRRYQCTCRFQAIRIAALRLQKHAYTRAAQRSVAGLRRERAALKLQGVQRGRQARKAYLRLRQAVLIQQAWRRSRCQAEGLEHGQQLDRFDRETSDISYMVAEGTSDYSMPADPVPKLLSVTLGGRHGTSGPSGLLPSPRLEEGGVLVKESTGDISLIPHFNSRGRAPGWLDPQPPWIEASDPGHEHLQATVGQSPIPSEPRALNGSPFPFWLICACDRNCRPVCRPGCDGRGDDMANERVVEAVEMDVERYTVETWI